ncbi:MAG: hypothetical protein Q9174_005877, partial [Haloplaca sp. 1 TL-2023]
SQSVPKMDLEVDHHNEESQKIVNAPTNDKYPVQQQQQQPWSQPVVSDGPSVNEKPSGGVGERKYAGLSKTVMLLSVALALAVVLAVVSAGVAGSLAAKRQRSLDSCLERNDPNDPANAPAYCSNTDSATPDNTTTPSIRSIQPSSECANLTSPVSAIRGDNQYNLHCASDLPTDFGQGNDLIGVWVYTMQECINACSYWNWDGSVAAANRTCYAVSFEYTLPQANCWLKGFRGMSFVASDKVDSAVLLLS